MGGAIRSGLNRYDLIAGYYDLLARIVFGKSIVQAQLWFLGEIKPGSEILVIGGGTGRIAEAILERTDATIIYVEASAKMIEIARRVTNESKRITFIHGTEQSISDDMMFDVIITNFFLDLFDEAELGKLMAKLGKHLRKKPLWLVADFSQENWWQRFLLKAMYKFFKVTTGLKTSTLPDWRSAMTRMGLVELKCRAFYKGFIRSCVFESSER